jgi:hypothetical protein
MAKHTAKELINLLANVPEDTEVQVYENNIIYSLGGQQKTLIPVSQIIVRNLQEVLPRLSPPISEDEFLKDCFGGVSWKDFTTAIENATLDNQLSDELLEILTKIIKRYSITLDWLLFTRWRLTDK